MCENTCANCKFAGEPQHRSMTIEAGVLFRKKEVIEWVDIFCYRYPKTEKTSPNKWCGEWSRKQ